MAGDKPVLGDDYDLERWSNGDRDESGALIWHERYPNNDEWESVRIVTLNFDPEGEGSYRNYYVSPDRPLQPYASDDGSFEDYYDLDDLAAQAFLAYGFEV